MERGAATFGRATFVMDRGYDDNKMFFFHGKWVPATQLRNQRKGKIKRKCHKCCKDLLLKMAYRGIFPL